MENGAALPVDIRHYRVFIASPGGLEAERQAFRDVLVEYNADDAIKRGVSFDPVGWEETLGGLGRPQSLINDDLASCDFFVMLLWDTWGSPTGRADDQDHPYTSGTEEEYRVAMAGHSDEAMPMRQLVVFFKGVDAHQLKDPGPQLTNVLEFRQELQTDRTLLYKTFDEVNEFQAHMRRHLHQWVRDHEAGFVASETEVAVDLPESADVQDLRDAADELTLVDDESASLIVDAKRHANQGELVEAETLFARALTSPPVAGGVYVEYGDYLLRVGRVAAAQVMYEKASEEADEHSQAGATAQARLGDIAKLRGNLDDAVELYGAAQNLAEQHRFETVVAYTSLRLGRVADSRSDWDEAEELYNKSLEIYERLDDQAGIATVYRGLGDVAFRRSDWDEAEELYNKALEIYERLDDQAGIGAVYGNLGNVAFRRGDWDEAEELYNKALEIYERLGNQANIATVSNNLGLVATSRSDLDQAEELYNKSLEIYERLGDQAEIARTYANLGNVARSRGDSDRAEELRQKARSIRDRLGR